MTKKRIKQIQAMAAEGNTHAAIARVFEITVDQVRLALAPKAEPVMPKPAPVPRGPVRSAHDVLREELLSRPSPTVCNGFGPSPRRRIGPKLTDSEQWMLDSARRARGGGRGSAT